MRILIFGGSFDPVHRGHVALLKAADRRIRPDRILLIPTGRPPHKPGPDAAFADRAGMLRAALAGSGLLRRVRIDPIEERRRGTHYTYRTLRLLGRRFPGAEFFLLLGSDQLASFHTWHRPQEILKRCRIVGGLRRGAKRGRVPGAVWLPGSFPEISSTQARQRLVEAKGVGALLAPPVTAWIRRRGLYGSGWIQKLKRMLAHDRMTHTYAVAELAAELAEQHGVDAWKAQQAALLHDCGRSIRGLPVLRHAAEGARLARTLFGVRDREVLQAIADHTLGRVGMGPISRVVYAADACSKDRAHPEARRIRKVALRDLMRGVVLAARNKRAWVLRQGHRSDPRAERFLKWAQREAKR